MLFLKKDFNVSISESAMHPIAFPLAEHFKPYNSMLMKDRVPYLERLHTKYHVTDVEPDLPDEVVVIESASELAKNSLYTSFHPFRNSYTIRLKAKLLLASLEFLLFCLCHRVSLSSTSFKYSTLHTIQL
ncbi:hypothetical protein ANCCAN_19080 [Ancylostoma caninum]|uniref:Uncharacterized protein n=1 Tax=Ancylostoma caninum TaxID=29170 RepID=A0A368FSE0_ANCCA|nr:hypothetical protein ANCCAN_19080 [Ancylostoma caninum]